MSSESLLYAKVPDLEGKILGSGIAISSVLLQKSPPATSIYCCSMAPPSSQNKSISFIAFRDILWCDVNEDTSAIVLTYVDPKSPKCMPAVDLALHFASQSGVSLRAISDQILQNAYKGFKISPSIAIIINPYGGQSRALQIYNDEILPILRAAHVDIEYMETTHYQHATQMARDLDIAKYDIVACCSGDGIPHEVINGFFQRPDHGVAAFNKIALTQLPCGSGNAMARSSHGPKGAAYAAFSMLKSHSVKLDVMAVVQPSSATPQLSFLSQTYGVVADADIGTEHLRWMGSMRFDVGVATRVLTKAKYPCDVYVEYAVESKHDLDAHFRSHVKSTDSQTPRSVDAGALALKYPSIDDPPPTSWKKLPASVTDNLSVFYVGKMPYVSASAEFFPAALPNDGAMDLVITNTNTGILDSLSILTSIENGQHIHHRDVIHAKIKGYRLVPKMPAKDHYISVDGENFPFEPLQVEVLPSVVSVLLPDGLFVETSFHRKQV